MDLGFSCVKEEKAGEKWQSHFQKTWPLYHKWFVSEGFTHRKGYLTSSEQLRYHMPELFPIYEHLVTLAGGGDLQARFLSMYCPPAYLTGCSQLAWTKKESTFLIRNYDYSYNMFEGLMLYTNWLQPVIGISDCNWGLLDGFNGSGLAISLTFGGRKVIGEGFGIPLLIRYVLEVSHNTHEAISILKRVPVHMAYNVTVVDRANRYATLYLSPDRVPIEINTPASANHQTEVEWGDYASMSKTIERQAVLDQIVASPKEDIPSIIEKFLVPPLYNTSFHKGFGTLYTIAYDLQLKEVRLIWPNNGNVLQSFDKFAEQRIPLHQLGTKVS
jgi:predicted choloylglycine hydrolase